MGSSYQFRGSNKIKAAQVWTFCKYPASTIVTSHCNSGRTREWLLNYQYTLWIKLLPFIFLLLFALVVGKIRHQCLHFMHYVLELTEYVLEGLIGLVRDPSPRLFGESLLWWSSVILVAQSIFFIAYLLFYSLFIVLRIVIDSVLLSILLEQLRTGLCVMSWGKYK